MDAKKLGTQPASPCGQKWRTIDLAGHETNHSRSVLHFGLTKRETFAIVALHAELTTCGVPGQACDAMIAAADRAGRSPEEQMAWNACCAADALLAELAKGQQP